MVGGGSPFVRMMSEVGRLFAPHDGVDADAHADPDVDNFLRAGEIFQREQRKSSAELFPEAVKFFGKDWKTCFRTSCHCQQRLAQRLLASTGDDVTVINIAQNTFACHVAKVLMY